MPISDIFSHPLACRVERKKQKKSHITRALSVPLVPIGNHRGLKIELKEVCDEPMEPRALRAIHIVSLIDDVTAVF